MFSDCQARVTQLKAQDPRFSLLLRRHAALDQHVRNMKSAKARRAAPVLECIKQEKQQLEAELCAILQAMPAGTPA